VEERYTVINVHVIDVLQATGADSGIIQRQCVINIAASDGFITMLTRLRVVKARTK